MTRRLNVVKGEGSAVDLDFTWPGFFGFWQAQTKDALLHFGSFVAQSLLGPIMTIALTLVYYDERVRKEAFDLEHMMRQLDTTVLRTPRTA